MSIYHNYNTNCVCYTGTHDNKTVKHWLKSEEHYKLDYAKKYLRLFSYDIYTQGFIDVQHWLLLLKLALYLYRIIWI